MLAPLLSHSAGLIQIYGTFEGRLMHVLEVWCMLRGGEFEPGGWPPSEEVACERGTELDSCATRPLHDRECELTVEHRIV